MNLIKLFISYSHKDDPLREQLVNHLGFLEDEGVVQTWCDKDILAGKQWETEIDAKLNDANIILLMVSSNYKGSSYCRLETERARERYEAGEAKVIPILLRECYWQIAWFGKLEKLPKNGVPVTEWPSRHKAFTDIAKEIHKVVKEVLLNSLAGSQPSVSASNAQTETAPPIAEDQASSEAPKVIESDSSSLAIGSFDDYAQDNNVIENFYNKLQLLSEQEQARYFEVAVFPSGIAIPLATLRKLWAGDLSEEATNALCTHLRELSLLNYDDAGGFLSLHELIRLQLIKQDIGNNQDYYQPRLPSIHHQLLNAHKPSPVRKWSAMLDDEPYFWDHLAFHLKEAERTDELMDTLDDWQYLIKKTRLRGAVSIESDLSIAEEIAPDDYRLRTIQLIFDNFRGLFDSWVMAGSSKAERYAEVRSLEDLNMMLQDQAQSLRSQYLTLKFKLPDLPPIGVRSCRFSYDGRWIVSASDDGTIIVWEAQSGRKLYTLEKLHVWDENLGKKRIKIDGHKDVVYGCDINWAADKLIVLVSADDGTLRTWNPDLRNVSYTSTEHSGAVIDCCFSPNGKHFVSASSDSTLMVWTTRSEKPFRTLKGHSGSVNSCAYGNSGKWIISAGSDGTLKVWGDKSDEPLHTLPAHSSPINCCSFNEKRRLIVSASDDKTLRIWDVNKIWDANPKEPLHTLQHSGPVNGCCFSLDGELIVSASSDHTLRIWDVQSGNCRTTFKTDGEMFCCAMYEEMIVAGGARGLYFLKLVQ